MLSKIGLIIVFLIISVKVTGKPSRQKDTIYVNQKIVIYDTVRIYDTIRIRNININKKLKILKSKSIDSVNMSNDLLKSATNIENSIILNENNKNVKIMKKTIFTSVAMLFINVAVNSQDTLKMINEDNNLNNQFYVQQKNNYYSVALGAGIGYGVMGAKFQARYGDIFGYGYQVGFGVSLIAEKGKILESRMLSFGAKIYPYKWLYLNPQFATHQIKSIEYAALMLGGDWFLNNRFGINAGIGVYWGDDNMNPMFDAGIAYKF